MIKLSRGTLPSKTKCHFLYFELTCFWMGQENKGKSHIEGILKNKEFLDSRFYMCFDRTSNSRKPEKNHNAVVFINNYDLISRTHQQSIQLHNIIN